MQLIYRGVLHQTNPYADEVKKNINLAIGKYRGIPLNLEFESIQCSDRKTDTYEQHLEQQMHPFRTGIGRQKQKLEDDNAAQHTLQYQEQIQNRTDIQNLYRPSQYPSLSCLDETITTLLTT